MSTCGSSSSSHRPVAVPRRRGRGVSSDEDVHVRQPRPRRVPWSGPLSADRIKWWTRFKVSHLGGLLIMVMFFYE